MTSNFKVNGVLIIFKEKIAQRFSRAASDYDEVAHIQRKCAQLLVERTLSEFSESQPQHILDLGTGTGYMVDYLRISFPNAHYTVNDCALEMLKQCKKKFSSLHITYQLGDLERISFPDQDLVVSNFVFQWLAHPLMTLQRLYSKTQVFSFSCLLEGTFSQWYELLKHWNVAISPPVYPKFSHIQRVCEEISKGKVRIWRRSFTLNFSSIRQFMHYLQCLGASAVPVLSTYGALKKLLATPEFSFEVQYNVFFAILTQK
ncbi:methyltransferase domain-containing protein [Holospora curviuscula]|uniref:Malonyl-[acyl-carrier protein] O-methyltransferase n=1 Tax=Holospora curviuscula TaxID=1082868 RepID=A0A2S5R7E9_9PROT|nr:methyltransferase domain-containing protein [Holospora curviuscula]PPE03230.1 Malonyl-[acyl-carrier protein] O-methyltransferase [Holospora curviuscula]